MPNPPPLTNRQRELVAIVGEMNYSQGYARTPDIADVLGVTRESAYEALHRLVNRGALEYERGYKPQTGARVDYYWIPGRKPVD